MKIQEISTSIRNFEIELSTEEIDVLFRALHYFTAHYTTRTAGEAIIAKDMKNKISAIQ